MRRKQSGVLPLFTAYYQLMEILCIVYSYFVKMLPNIDKNVQKHHFVVAFFVYFVEKVYFCCVEVCMYCIFMQKYHISFGFDTIAVAF